ncbi:MAG TPA: hypothetical protein VGF71_04975 [Caulobacteraceae bacterium]|jgi:hypothetical protein
MTRATKRPLIAACPSGQTGIEFVGAPILTAVCCCESCQAAGRRLETAPGAPLVVRTDGGTDYCLYRKDRVRVSFGGEHLEERRLTPSSSTRRVVATCCNAPMFLDFTKGHWLTLYRDRLPGDPPRLEMRVMTKAAGVSVSDDLPNYPAYPARFMVRLLAAWAAMGFGRPELAW